MSRVLNLSVATFGTVALLSAASLHPAAARILCDGEFQINQYGRFATPYCGDQVIARVANEFGWRESAAQVGTNPLAKVYICQTLGNNDWRLQGPCAGYVPHGGGIH
jgi:hypothetical protein